MNFRNLNPRILPVQIYPVLAGSGDHASRFVDTGRFLCLFRYTVYYVEADRSFRVRNDFISPYNGPSPAASMREWIEISARKQGPRPRRKFRGALVS
jgi:hypothetical protein